MEHRELLYPFWKNSGDRTENETADVNRYMDVSWIEHFSWDALFSGVASRQLARFQADLKADLCYPSRTKLPLIVTNEPRQLKQGPDFFLNFTIAEKKCTENQSSMHSKNDHTHLEKILYFEVQNVMNRLYSMTKLWNCKYINVDKVV